MRKEWPLTHFGLKNQKWVIMFSSNTALAWEKYLLIGLQLTVVGCVQHEEYFHFLAWHSIAEIPKTMAN